MEGREDMSSSPYNYLHRGHHHPHHHHHGLHLPSGFMPVANNTNNISVQPNVSDSTSTHFAHGFNLSSSSSAAAAAAAAVASDIPSVEPVKKKRGRPRKYGPDRSNVSLELSPLSSKSPADIANTNPKKRGRPPGSGRKQQLSSLGEWMNSSAGLAFAPHVMHIAAGEDVAMKILSFSQHRSRAVCILSATGSISAVSLRQPTSSATNVTYEGRFQILCLSGSYLVAETGGPRNRTGGISVSLCSSDGNVIGGAVGDMLKASGPVQVVLCSFTYNGGGFKMAKENQLALENTQPDHKTDNISSSSPTPHSGQKLSLSSSTGMMSGFRQNTRNPQMDIDLMRG